MYQCIWFADSQRRFLMSDEKQEFPPAHELLPTLLEERIVNMRAYIEGGGLSDAGLYVDYAVGICAFLRALTMMAIPEKHLEKVIEKLQELCDQTAAEGMFSVAHELREASNKLKARRPAEETN